METANLEGDDAAEILSDNRNSDLGAEQAGTSETPVPEDKPESGRRQETRDF